MAVPKRKVGKARKRSRAAHHGLALRHLRPCARCNQPGPSHRVCANCGHYAGREVVDKEAD
jgi:large subunit ribosomal protein L32